MLKLENTMALSPGGPTRVHWSTGQLLATYGPTTPLRLWTAAQTKPVAILRDSEGVQSVAFSPDNSRVAATAPDGSILLWECDSGTPVAISSDRQFRGPAVWSPDGARLAAALPGSGFGVWESYRGKPSQRFETNGPVTAIVWSDDGQRVACIAGMEPIFVWNRSGKLYRRLDVPRMKTALTWGPKADELTVGYADGGVEIRDLRSANHARAVLRGHQAAVLSLVCGADRSWIASKARDGKLMIWDAGSGEQLYSGREPVSDGVSGLTTHPALPMAASADGATGELKIWQWLGRGAASATAHPTATARKANAISIFVSYSSKDEGMRSKLQTHLDALRQEGVEIFYDGRIEPGTQWREEILRRLDEAQLILLLVSANFMASDFCYSLEAQRALERHRRREARVIPILLRVTPQAKPLLSELQAIPKRNGQLRPISDYKDRDRAYCDVAMAVNQAVCELKAAAGSEARLV